MQRCGNVYRSRKTLKSFHQVLLLLLLLLLYVARNNLGKNHSLVEPKSIDIGFRRLEFDANLLMMFYLLLAGVYGELRLSILVFWLSTEWGGLERSWEPFFKLAIGIIINLIIMLSDGGATLIWYLFIGLTGRWSDNCSNSSSFSI